MFSQTLPLTRPALGLAFAALVAGVSTAQADFQLSERYTDADGDLVADVPEDESQWRDPDTLVFAYTPVEDPAVYADVWSGFLDHMEEVTGKKGFFVTSCGFGLIEQAAHRTADQVDHRDEVGLVPVATCA